ncbi:hypothetical protein HZB02_02130 [Candidatus Woesearchaeota archaeon]|nr:hypothetical protein [Candidatus Woesearchaeota archaeon]
MDRLVSGPHDGAWSGLTEAIAFGTKDNVKTSTVYHEIKHAKMDTLLRKNPEFLEKWKQLATDDNGKSLYLTSLEKICSRIRSLFVNDQEKKSDENLRLGFMSQYARTDVSEDIAVLCGTVEENPREFIPLLMRKGYADDAGLSPQNPKIAAKVRLAEQYGLIPQEFTEYLSLEEMYSRSIISENRVLRKGLDPDEYHELLATSKQFLEAAQTFVNKYPTSIYYSKVSSLRAFLIEEMADTPNDKEVISAYRQVLKAPWKDPVEYRRALNVLANLEERAKTADNNPRFWRDAYDQYSQAYRDGNINTVINGLNLPVNQ